jgi:excisionase family DNA binding protein
MISHPQLPPDMKLLLSIAEACALLGVGRSTLYTLIMSPTGKEPKLPSMKVGRYRKISRKDLDHYIDQETHPDG